MLFERNQCILTLAEDTSPMGAKLLIFEPQNFPIRLFSNIYIHLAVLNIA
jgi:hypothetical protein